MMPGFPSETIYADVIIVGTGPAGLLLATQLSRFPSISVKIIEKRSEKLVMGQADGIQCRTVEMFESFDFADQVLREAYWVNEVNFWGPTTSGDLHRTSRIQDSEEDLSEFPHVILNQARIHDFFLEKMKESPTQMEPLYSTKLLDVSIDDTQEYPVTCRVSSSDGAETQLFRSRYAVGCDGARSVFRSCLGINLEGSSANVAWGVMDIFAVTNFPDIRTKCTIHSKEDGAMILIPREGDKLVRMYIEMSTLDPKERAANKNYQLADIIAKAKRILGQFTLEITQVYWWSIYEIGQRLSSSFDNVPPGSKALPCAFLAGDACHTHSPKAGQGMNVSMHDAFNLGWKLVAVLLGYSPPTLLSTYSSERQMVAKDLINFDKKLVEMISRKPQEATKRSAEFSDYFVQAGHFMAGTSTKYGPSSIISATSTSAELASGFPVGMVLRFSDAKPIQLGHTLRADARWHLIVFAGDWQDEKQKLAIQELAYNLRDLLDLYTRKGRNKDSVIDYCFVFSNPRKTIKIEDLPPILFPIQAECGLRDYNKVFTDEPSYNFGFGEIYRKRGIAKQGCVLIVRPDQFVAAKLSLLDSDKLISFFSAFMVPAADAS